MAGRISQPGADHAKQSRIKGRIASSETRLVLKLICQPLSPLIHYPEGFFKGSRIPIYSLSAAAAGSDLLALAEHYALVRPRNGTARDLHLPLFRIAAEPEDPRAGSL